MPDDLPAVTGNQLIRLLQRDGFIVHRRHGRHVSLRKPIAGGPTIVTVVPSSRVALPIGTLMAILGPKQTGLGRDGLLRLIDEHGLR